MIRVVNVIVTLTVYYLAGQGAQALPTSESAIVLHSLPNNCNDLHQCRTIWDIVCSCLATIFACTWVALHMNIPGPDEKWDTIALRKVGIMMLALIAPEIVVVWAMRQWLVARRIGKKYEKYGWTHAHGFIALMGGFMRFGSDGEPYTILPEDLRPHLRKGEINITEKAIKDRSKGNTLSKGFAVLQTGWFILQSVARKSQSLPVTELEIVTLAFAILNFATYTLWWNKPLDVQDPFLVYQGPTPDWGDEEADEDNEGEDRGGGWVMIKHAVTSVWHAIRNAVESAIKIIRKVPGAIRNAVGRATNRRRRSKSWALNTISIPKILRNVLLVPLILVMFPVAWVAGMLIDMGTGGDEYIILRSKRVGTFYSGKLKRDEHSCGVVVAVLFAMIFGAIHCIAWSFRFPTDIEQWLWHISSLAMMCMPVVLLVSDWLGFFDRFDNTNTGWVETLLGMALTLVHLSFFTLYVLARVTLLVLAFISLRSLPPDAYRTVHWTTFIPHM